MPADPKSFRPPGISMYLFVLLGVWITLVQLAENLDFIEATTEGLLKLVAVIGCLLIIGWSSRQNKPSLAIKVAFFALGVGATTEIGLDFLGRIDSLEGVPLIGRGSQSREILEKCGSGLWFGSGFIFVFLIIRSLQQSNYELTSALEDLKAAQESNIRRERLSALGEMSSGIAHDLNNTLAPVVTYSELLLADKTITEEQRGWLDCILQAGLDAVTVLKRLGLFYRGPDPSQLNEEIDLKEMIEQLPLLTRPKWYDQAQLRGIEYDFQLDLTEVPPIVGNASELRTVFTNLVFNAIDAMPDGGTINFELFARGNTVMIEVTDTGVGMSEQQAAHCLEPFYSTKVEKSGLGLSVCHGIVKQHGGAIEIDVNQPKGVLIRLSFPTSQRQTGETNRSPQPPVQLSSVRCLYIEDDDAVRDAFTTLLGALGGEVDAVADGDAGLEKLKDRDYDVIFTDLCMQGKSGAEVFQLIQEQSPQTPVVVVSGWPREEVLSHFSEQRRPRFIIEKPITLDRVREVFHSLAPQENADSLAGTPEQN